MKTTLAALIGMLVLAAVSGQAQAASDADARIAALERQVAALAGPQAAEQTPAGRIAALQRQTTALARRVTTLERQLAAVRKTANETELAVIGALAYSTCLTAVTADAFAGTWNVIDQIAAATQAGKVYFGQQAVVNDGGICTAIRVTRVQTVPPSVAPFSALTALLGRLP